MAARSGYCVKAQGRVLFPWEWMELRQQLLAGPMPDRLTGTVTLHNANWKTDTLPTAVEIAQATLHLGGGASVWDPVVFAYGPLKGTARVEFPDMRRNGPAVPAEGKS